MGVSIGIERVFAIMEAQLRAQAEAVSSWVAAFLASSCCSPWGVRVPSWQRSGRAQAEAVGVYLWCVAAELVGTHVGRG